MSYKELIDQSIQGVYEKGIATKILQHMGRIRNASDITQARRWPMELLQNAGDLAYEDRRVSVRVRLEKNQLIFEHTGKPFRVRDILSIVNQVSSKNPGETVGQFGTGFITTYQLSEKVEIRSVLKEEGLPYKRFSVILDRSGKTHEELHEAIEKNMSELSIADEGEELRDYDKDGFNTAFVYHLESSHSREIALTGMRDLRDTILYIMLFSQSIKSVELEFAEGLLQEEGRHFVYERGNSETVSNGQITETVIIESGKQHILRHISDNDITIAAEYDIQKGYLKLSERVPRLFIDFPLIGAEEFPFPMVINSRRLQPNEPRSGIALVDLEQSEDSRKNKAVMDEAVSLYGIFLKEAVKMEMPGIENLLYIPRCQDNKEWSRQWVETHLYNKIYEYIADEKIFDTLDGRQSLNCQSLSILQAADAKERQGMIKICADIEGMLVPEGDVDWYAALKNYSEACNRSVSLEGLMKKASEWSQLGKIKCSRIEWCQKLYELGISNDETATLICTSDVAILPNQREDDRQLYKVSELYRDDRIPEVLKDVSEDLDKLKASQSVYGSAANAIEIRKKLLHIKIKAENLAQLQDFPLPTLTEYIAQRSRREFPVEQFLYHKDTYLTAWNNAWIKMLCCGPDKALHDICRHIFAEELPEYKKLDDERISPSLWKNSYIGLLAGIFERLEKAGCIDLLKAEMDADWMSGLFNAALKYYEVYSLSGRKIFPNQKGEFCRLLDLYEDKIEAQEMKKIACCFSQREKDCDILEELLYGQIKLDDGWNLRNMGNKEVTSRISRAISRLLSEGNLNDAPEELQDACALLLTWLQEHPDKAKEYFPEYSTEEEQAKLVTSKAVVNLQRKSRGFDKLMEMAGTEDIDELMEMIEKGKSNKKESEGGYDEDSGVYFGDEFDSMNENERKNAFREIGRAGELYAMEQIRKMFAERGWSVTKENPGIVTLEKDSKAESLTDAATGNNDGADWIGIADNAYNRAELYQPDTEEYHQEGWDIRIRLWRADEEQPMEFYTEVKTHTTRSKARNILQLSNEQMRVAASFGGSRFAAVMVDYDWGSHMAVGMCWFPNILEQISKGRICSAQGKYWLFAI